METAKQIRNLEKTLANLKIRVFSNESDVSLRDKTVNALKTLKEILKNKTFQYGTTNEQLEVLYRNRNIIFRDECLFIKNMIYYLYGKSLRNSPSYFIPPMVRLFKSSDIILEVEFQVIIFDRVQLGLKIHYSIFANSYNIFKDLNHEYVKELIYEDTDNITINKDMNIIAFSLGLIEAHKEKRDHKILLAEANMIRYIRNCLTNLRVANNRSMFGIIDKNYIFGDKGKLPKLFKNLKVVTKYSIPDEIKLLITELPNNDTYLISNKEE